MTLSRRQIAYQNEKPMLWSREAFIERHVETARSFGLDISAFDDLMISYWHDLYSDGVNPVEAYQAAVDDAELRRAV